MGDWTRRAVAAVEADDLIDARALALALGLTVGAIRQRHLRGKLHPVRKGPHGTWLYRRVEAFADTPDRAA